MKDILDEIIANKRLELQYFKQRVPLCNLRKDVEKMLCDEDAECPSMRQALMQSPTGIIAEFKRKSPSKGWIKEGGKADIIPLSYQQNGASALSILTDQKYFGGGDMFIRTARDSGVTLPILYKNFVIDEYQLYQARDCGASAVLLIAAALTVEECKSLLAKAHELGLEVLLEMHSVQEMAYAELLPDMYGINNRNLGTFVTDVQNSFRLAELLPKDACKVSESGIGNPATIKDLQAAGFNGFLIGESFMKTDNPGAELHRFITSLTK